MARSIENPYNKKLVSKINSSKRFSDFVKGAGSVFDITGNTFGEKIKLGTPHDDARKIKEDWDLVARDMQKAINLF